MMQNRARHPPRPAHHLRPGRPLSRGRTESKDGQDAYASLLMTTRGRASARDRPGRRFSAVLHLLNSSSPWARRWSWSMPRKWTARWFELT